MASVGWNVGIPCYEAFFTDRQKRRPKWNMGGVPKIALKCLQLLDGDGKGSLRACYGAV